MGFLGPLSSSHRTITAGGVRTGRLRSRKLYCEIRALSNGAAKTCTAAAGSALFEVALDLAFFWPTVLGNRSSLTRILIGLAALLLNRLANYFVKVLFRINLNDTTNAFKAYRKNVIDHCRPLIAPHFNITVELPIKAIVRGFSWTVIPITWRNRRTGSPKLRIKEMGSRYLFICLYIWLEKYFSCGDYRRDGS